MNSSSKPPSPLVFFLDRSLGRNVIANRLHEAGAKIEIHDDHFPPDAKDEDWLREVGNRGWLALTKDHRMRHRTPALAVIRKTGARVFVIGAGNLRAREMGEIFAKALPGIDRFARKNTPPFIAKVTRRGSVSMWVNLVK